MAISFDKTHRDRFGEIAIRFRRDFVVGHDKALIKLRSMYGGPLFGNVLSSPDDVDFNEVVALGLAGNTHLVDCSYEDPEAYRFDYYGLKSMVCDGKNFRGHRVADASWRALRNFGASEYARIKSRAEPDLVDVSYTRGGRRTSYRRLALPLSRDGGKITHLLVAMLMHEVEVVIGSADHMSTRILS